MDYGKQEGKRDVMEAEVGPMWSLAWKMEGSHKARNTDKLTRLEKAKKEILFLKSLQETWLCWKLDFRTSDLKKSKIIYEY